MSYGFRLLLKWARLVHLYVTMFGFLLVLFFAVTGFMLNHPDWFGFAEKEEREVKGKIATSILANPPDKLAVVEALRKHFGAVGEMDSFRATESDDEPFDVRFRAPGHDTMAIIDRKTGDTTVTHELYGVLGILTDLHRGEGSGKHTGDAWSVVIDAVAILSVIVSITGFVLWASLNSRGKHGLSLMGLGLALAALIYFLFVP